MPDEPGANAPESRITLVEVLDRAAEKVAGRFADKPDVEIAVRESIAQTYHGLASYGKAERQWRAIRDLARRPGGDPATLYLAQRWIAHLLLDQHNFGEDTFAIGRSALEGFMRILGPDHPETIEARNVLAEVYRNAGRGADAIPFVEEALKQLESTQGPDHMNTLKARITLGLAYLAAQRPADAILILEPTLMQFESKDSDVGDLILCGFNLASAYSRMGRIEKSISVYEKTLMRIERTQGKFSLGTFNTLHQLGHCVQIVRPAQAEPLFRRALDGYRKTQGSNGAITLELTGDLANLLDELGRPSEAEVFFRADRRLPNQGQGRRSRVRRSPGTMRSLSSETKKWDEAEPILRECLALREKAQPKIWSTFNAKSMLGAAFLGQKKYKDAERLLLAGYEGLKQVDTTIPSGGRTRIPEAIERLVQLYEATKQKDEAAKWRKELDAIKSAEKKLENKP